MSELHMLKKLPCYGEGEDVSKISIFEGFKYILYNILNQSLKITKRLGIQSP